MSRAGSATWNLSPTSNNWNTAANWTPATVPNLDTDTATFGLSNVTSLMVSSEPSGVGPGEIVFAQGASAYTITVKSTDVMFAGEMEFHGAGIVNDSGITQNFVTARSGDEKSSGQLYFKEVSSAGDNVTVTNEGGASPTGNGIYGGYTQFWDTATAANATFISNGGVVAGAFGGFTDLLFFSNAASATFISNPAAVAGAAAAYTLVQTLGNIGGSTFINNPALVSGAEGGWTEIDFGTSAGASFIANGSLTAGPQAGQIYIYGGDGYATFTGEGGQSTGAEGGLVDVFALPNSDQTVVVANAGVNGGDGGHIVIDGRPIGDLVQFQLFGNGLLDLALENSGHFTAGSLEGDGTVSLAQNFLQIGGNNLSKTFSGVIQGSGSVTKIGAGALTLSGANTYSGPTTVSAGTLLVSNKSGSATGTGVVQVNVGTLGGGGIISGSVRLGTESGPGCALIPAFGSNKQATLTVQSSLTLHADATYTYSFKARRNQVRTDLVVANEITLTNPTIVLHGTTQARMRLGTVLTLISNRSASPISGIFYNLPEGAIVNVNGNNLQASYSGGDGNDLTLTVVP